MGNLFLSCKQIEADNYWWISYRTKLNVVSLSQQNSDKPTVFRFMAKCLPLYMFTALSLYHSICLPLYIFTALYVYRSSFSLEHILRVVPGSWMIRIYNKNKNNHLSVISQKGESQNGCFKKTKHATISEKRMFLTPWYAYVRPFALLPTLLGFKFSEKVLRLGWRLAFKAISWEVGLRNCKVNFIEDSAWSYRQCMVLSTFLGVFCIRRFYSLNSTPLRASFLWNKRFLK